MLGGGGLGIDDAILHDWVGIQDIDNGTASLLRHAAFWGTWYGVALGVVAEAENDALFAWALLGGDAAIAAGIPLAKAWNPSPGRIRLITAAGLAGGLAGVGLDLLLEVDDDQTGVAIPLIGTTVGLIGGAMLGSDRSSRSAATTPDVRTALLNLDRRWSFDLPMPLPTAIPALMPDGRIRSKPGLQFRLFDARF